MKKLYNLASRVAYARHFSGCLRLLGLLLALLPLGAQAANPVLTIQALGSATNAANDVTIFVDQVEIVLVSNGTVVSGAVANPSFEMYGPLDNGNYGYNPGGASWTFNGRSGIAQNGSAFTPPTAPEGLAVAVVQSQGGTSGLLQQTLALGAGIYQVRFRLAQRTCCSSADQRLSVLIGGVAVGTAVSANTGGYDTFTSASFAVDAPTLTAVAPIPGGLGQSITLTGTNLSSPTALTINGANALANIVSNTATTVVVRVPVTAAATGSVSITTAGGTATRAFTVMAAPGNALAFDGTNDYTNTPSATALDLTTSLTIETWINPTGTGSTIQDVLCKSSNSQNTGYIFPRTDDTWNTLRIWLHRGSGWSQYTVPYGAAYLGRWHHVAATYDGTTVRMYIDGVEVIPTATGNVVTGAVTTNTNPLALGNQTGYSEYYRGTLDEVRIYNTVRTPAEIRTDMLNTPTLPTTGLVAYYNFDQGTSAGNNTGFTTLYDLVSAAPATLSNFALTSGNTTSNYVESYALVVPVATAATSVGGTGFTANWTAPAIGTVDNGYRVDVSTVSTFASVISGSPFTASSGTSLAITGLTPSTTYYYRVRADKTSVTGQGDYSNTITAATCALPQAIAQNVTVTLNASGAASTTATAVNNGSTANCGPAAVGSFSLSPTAFTCADAVPNAATNTALAFTGTQYAQGTHTLLPQGNAPRTIEAWVYPTVASQGGDIFNYGTATANQRSGLTINGTNLYYVGENNDQAGATPLTPNVWHHVAATYDGTTLKLYVDGVLDATKTVATAFNTTGTTWRMSQRITTSGEFLNGRLDEVRIWARPLTAAEITQSFAKTNPTSLAGLVARWDMREGSGSSLGDVTGNSAAAVITGTATWPTPGIAYNGVMTVLTVTDTNGNISRAAATVTVVDNTAPTVVAQNVTIVLSASGTATTTAAAVNNGSSDNCAVQTLELFGVEKVVNGTFNTNASGWTAANVDASGGYRSTSGNPGGMFILNDNGRTGIDPTLSQTVTGLTVGATYLLRGSYENFYGFGPVGVQAFAVDLDGNQLTTFPSPGIVWTPFSLRFTATATSHVLAFRGEIGTTDIDIAIDNISLLELNPTFTCANVGANTVVLVATDPSGNQGTATATVTVVDDIAPVFTACGLGTPASPFTNLNCVKGVATGTYTFSIGGNTFQGYVDGTTDGGGWVEILNYVHQGGTNPALNARTTSLPVQTSAVLGADESATAAWGHAAPALVAAMNPQEVRFYGQTSAHARVIDFKTSLPAVLSYIKTGTGSMNNLGASGTFTALPGHTANLPAATSDYFTNQDANALTEFPFYKFGTYHWGIKGLGNRWEVDDFPNGPGTSTVHRIFVRGSATGVPGNAVAAANTTGQCGANVTLTGTQPATDNCTPTITFSPASGSFFAVGTTTVTATATDASGNSSTSTFVVTVTDTEVPTGSGPTVLPAAPALATSNVPEAAGYGVLYQLDVPTVANFNALAAIPYTVNNAGSGISNPKRVAYFMELNNGVSTKWVWASMDNFAANLTQLGLPNPTANNKVWSQSVNNLNVFSSAGAGVTTGTNLGTGRVEMWRWNYTTANADNVPGANAGNYDFGDAVAVGSGNYGSFQVHNVTAGQTLLAYNNWGSNGDGGGIGNIGIGNQVGGSGHPDWTFQYNANTYTVKRIYILVPNSAAIAQAATVSLNAAGTVTVLPGQVTTMLSDNCTSAGALTVVVTPNTFTCANLGPNTVSVSVSDANGNTTTQNTVVTVTASPPTNTTTWNGATNTDWTNCANWSYGKVPDAATNAIIPTTMPRYPILPAGTYPVLSLTVNAGGSLTTAAGATLQVNGNFTNSGTATLSGTVAFVGSAATQTLSNASSFATVTVNKPSGNVQLAQNLTIATVLNMTSGTLTTATNQVSLGAAASISETETSYVIGRVTVTRTVTAGSAQAFSGIGLTLTPAASSPSPGTTLVARTTGTALSGVGTSQSVQRYFDIQPIVKTGLNVTMEFAYFTHELNGIPTANLLLFKSVTSTSGPWAYLRPTTLAANLVTRTGITDFSIWTLGNSANPLPVELTTFTATAEGDAAVRLAWTTASEKNSDRFEVERSLNGTAFERIGTVAAQGTKATTTTYALLDGKLPAGAGMFYYRLRQVDADGTFAYSPVRVVTLTPRLPGKLTLAPNPARATTLAGAQPGAPVEVYDALGRLVLSATADATGTAALILPARLAVGVYVVRSGTQAVRLVVE